VVVVATGGKPPEAGKVLKALFPAEVDRGSRQVHRPRHHDGDELCAAASMRRTMSPKILLRTEEKKIHGLR
jgi:hypothetical protein